MEFKVTAGAPSRPTRKQRAPSPRRVFWVRQGLLLLSGLMLGLSFPPSPLGILACFGLVPLLIVIADISKPWQALRSSFITFLVFHVITLNWTGGYAHGNDQYMMIAGGVTMLLHPLFYMLPMGAYLFVRKHLGDVPALVGLPFFWVGYEYTHTLSEWSFPWLTLGNSQSYDLATIQFISATGIFGLSFWIITVNVLAFALYSRAAHGKVSFRTAAGLLHAIGILLVVLLPKIHGSVLLAESERERGEGHYAASPSVTVGIIQPNLDPWEKWSTSPQATTDLYLRMTDSLLQRVCSTRPDLVLWPETAIPYYLLSPDRRLAAPALRAQIDLLGIPVLTGFPHRILYRDSTNAPPSAKRILATGQRYDTFNSAALIQPDLAEVQWYGKMKMVPFAERVPYADQLHFIDFLRWGVGIGGWQIGPDTTVFVEQRTGVRFSTMICYESTYPDFVAEFVRRGAQFITIITIDSWWAKMSGAYQHKQFAIFRAVENRRWVARCALGGISCTIDPWGRVQNETPLLSQAAFCATIGTNDERSFYTRHGEWFAQGALWLGLAMLVAAIGQKYLTWSRERLWSS